MSLPNLIKIEITREVGDGDLTGDSRRNGILVLEREINYNPLRAGLVIKVFLVFPFSNVGLVIINFLLLQFSEFVNKVAT